MNSICTMLASVIIHSSYTTSWEELKMSSYWNDPQNVVDTDGIYWCDNCQDENYCEGYAQPGSWAYADCTVCGNSIDLMAIEADNFVEPDDYYNPLDNCPV